MINSTNNIVIVGGGSAGWMTAAILIKAFPTRNITVVESPTVPIVGVGESTLAHINDYVQFLEIDEADFMEYTDASYKLSIKFTDFYNKDAGGFHYPFGEPVLEDTLNGIHDWFFKKALYPDIDVQDFARSYFPVMSLIENNKFSNNLHNNFHGYDPVFHSAYHFDATKFGGWLRDRYAIPRGVHHIIADVVNVNSTIDGISSLNLSTGDTVIADLYIDCTGWKSLLLGETLKEPFNSYSDMLPNNRAVATRIPYVDKEKELEPFTNCTAINNGWVWNIPLWSRIGTGYVYSDKYITPEDAREEFKQHLMSNKMVIPRTRDQVEELEFKDIPMRVGIHNRTWVKNCVAIGLSAGFIEPLESNGLFSVHEFLFKLIRTIDRPVVNQWDIDVYNGSVLNIFRNFTEFVALHYALSIRRDTQYWVDNSKRVYSVGLDQLTPQAFQGFYDLQHRKMFTNQVPVSAGITRIATGMNYPILDPVTVTMRQTRDKVDYKEHMAECFALLDKKKKFWSTIADSEPTLYQYLKNTIYKN